MKKKNFILYLPQKMIDNKSKDISKRHVRRFLKENNSPKKYNIQTLAQEFGDIDKKMSDLIETSDSLDKDGEGRKSWEQYQFLSRYRNEKIKSLLEDNEPDEMYDEVHDAILSDDDKFATMPEGYAATVIESHYSTIMRRYHTYAVVQTPKGGEYVVKVPTLKKMEIGRVFQ
jgi:AraC-like DNA-binding protein